LTAKKIDWAANLTLPVGKGATIQEFDAVVGADKLEFETTPWGEGKLKVNGDVIVHLPDDGSARNAFDDLEQVAERWEQATDASREKQKKKKKTAQVEQIDGNEDATPKPQPNLWLPGVPAFWPMAMARAILAAGDKLEVFYSKNFVFIEEEIDIHVALRPSLATPNRPRLDLRTMVLRDYGKPGGIPTLVAAPYAGHTAVIADYHDGQSLVQTLLANGINHVALTDWKSATEDMKDLEIDNYLADVVVAIDDLGGRVNLVGLCQGGWLSAMVAARFPHKVSSLVLAGAPIDTDAGSGPIKCMAHGYPISFYNEMVDFCGGLMKGKLVLQGWKSMHPWQHYIQEHIDLYEHTDDPAYPAKEEAFENWYENPIDLPGRWYLQVITQLFMQNRLARGEFVGLGRKLSLHDITCPVYLLAGATDDITTPEQVLEAAKYLGTPKDRLVQRTVPGGHLGLFMGTRALKECWSQIARWIAV
jgi:polyhydroxyalkanoate depolymerase